MSLTTKATGAGHITLRDAVECERFGAPTARGCTAKARGYWLNSPKQRIICAMQTPMQVRSNTDNCKGANTMADITKQVQEGFDGLKSQVNEKFSSVEDRLFNLEQRGAELPPGFGSTKRKSVVADALRCDQLAALQAGRTKSAVIPLTSSIKALVGDAGSSSDDSYSVLPQRAPEAMYNAPRRRDRKSTRLNSSH